MTSPHDGEAPAARMALRFLAASLVVAFAACRAEPAPANQRDPVGSASVPGTAWRPLGEWSGTGERQTGSFDITTGSLRVTWEASEPETGGGGRLRVSLHSAISGRPLETVVDVDAPGADTVYVAANPRVAYLLIESESLHWAVALEEGQQGVDE